MFSHKFLLTFLPLYLFSFLPSLAQDAIIEEQLTEFEVNSTRSAQLHELVVIRINNERADNQARLSISCSKDIDLTKFSATIADANGKVIKKLKKGDLTRSEYSQHLASDNYFYYISYKPNTYPVTVTFDWEQHFDRVISYPAFMPQNEYDIEVKQATYRLISPTDEPLRWRALNCQPDIQTRQEKGNTIHEIKMGPLSAVKRQPWGLPLKERVPIIYFAPASFDYKGTHCDLTDWHSLGQWAGSLLQDRDQLPQPLLDKLHELTDTCRTDRSKVEVVRKLMGETTRYVSIQLGIGGWQPMSATEVYQKGIGDCKALSNYLCSMLHALGLPADYVLISTRDRKMLPNFPTMQQFDHAVARVPLPGDTMWVECTNPLYPAGYALSGWSGHEALIVTPEGGVQTTTSVLPDTDCRKVNHYNVTVDAQGNAAITTHSLETGRCWQSDVRLTQMSQTDQKKALQSTFLLPTSTISEVNVQSQGTQLSLDWRAQSQGYARRNGQRLFIPISPTVYDTPRQNDSQPYTLDFRESGYVRIDSITLNLPEGYQVETLPKVRTIDSPMATYSLEVNYDEAQPQQVCLVARMQLRSGTYTDAEALSLWMQFAKERAQTNGSNIVVKRVQ